MFTAIILYIESGDILWLVVYICIYVHTYYTMFVYGVTMHISYLLNYVSVTCTSTNYCTYVLYVDVKLQLQLFKHCLKFTSEPKDALQLERTKL